MERTCFNTELNESNVGQEVTLIGWVSKRRDLGSIMFLDLRDRSGEYCKDDSINHCR